MSTSTYKASLHQLVEDLSEDQAARALASLKGALTDEMEPSATGVGLAERLHIGVAKVRDLRYGDG